MTARSRFSALFGAVALVAAVYAASAQGDPPEPPGQPTDAIVQRGDRYQSKPAGTIETLNVFFGPYTIGPGQDMNRFDVDVPVRSGYILAVSPSLRKADDLTEYVHQVAHIHHAHWFRHDIGNLEDNYWDYPGFGTHEWIFGNGDEETKADFQPRTDADPNGPIYGQYIPPDGVGPVIYMIHNKTSQPIVAYIRLKVTFMHGTPEELNQPGKRPVHDIRGMLMGRTFDVHRNAKGTGIWNTTAGNDPTKPKPIEWTSQVDGTLVGTGGHLHPGGLHIIVENRGSEKKPCNGSAPGGGVPIFNSEAVWHVAKFSEDFQMTVTDPHWRAPIHKGDRIRLTGYYENKDHSWITAMTHEGFYIDDQQPPRDGCEPYSVGTPPVKPLVLSKIPSCKGKRAKARRSCIRKQRAVRRKRARQVAAWKRAQFDPMQGTLSHNFYKAESICGEEYGAPACNKAAPDRGPGMTTDTVTIANFLYQPGDLSLSGQQGAPVQVKKGSSLRFVNADESANIRHSVTTCEWPCNGPYVSNYPFADGRWESGTLGFDVIDGGTPDPVAETPKDLAVGKYAYFCRIHPWMRGAFEVVP
jgi:plastocyanin